jgi:serine/threonine protein kinase
MSSPDPPPSTDRPPLTRAEARTTGDLAAHLAPAGSGPRVIADAEARAQTSALLAPGSIVADKYLIEGILGEGGLGVVVAATHLHLDQKVAIKYLRGSAPRDRTVTDRFLREARLAAQIKSDHVVRVFDVATLTDGTPYMVMEHLDGMDLRTVLDDSGATPFGTAIDYVLQACEALAEAHVQGIVHRDLKPDNLFLARRTGGKEVIKILDFGISKLSDKYTSSSRVNVVTQAGDRLGTPLYMSPEQLEGAPNVDARTDLWAMGVVLYELCTGTIPFTGDSLPALCTAVLTKTPIPPSTLKPELPPEIDLIIARCLAKAPDDRYQNVAELASELAPFASRAGQARVSHTVQTITDSGDTVRPPRWEAVEEGSVVRVQRSDAPAVVVEAGRSGRPKWVMAAGVVVVVGAACGVTGWWLTGGTKATSNAASTSTSTSNAASTSTSNAASTPTSTSNAASTPTSTSNAASTLDPTTTLNSTAQPAATASHAPAVAISVPGVRPVLPPPPRPAATARAASSSDTSGVLDPFQ